MTISKQSFLALALTTALTATAQAAEIDCPTTETQFRTINPTNIFNNLVRLDATPTHTSPPYPQVEVTPVSPTTSFGALTGVPFTTGFNVIGDEGAGVVIAPGSLGFSGACGMKLDRLHAYSLNGNDHDFLLTAISLDETGTPVTVFENVFTAKDFRNSANTSQIDLPPALGNLSVSYFMLNGWDSDIEETAALSDRMGIGPIRTLFTDANEIFVPASTVPLPSSVVALGMGIIGLGALARRRDPAPV